jgi:2'-5' RNA ligase
MDLRLFIAIDIPEHIKKEIGELLDILKKYDADIKWLLPENIHLTLKFLGATPESLVARIREALLPLVSSYEPFYITILSTGVFPSKKYPRIIWIGIVDSDILKELRDRIEIAMSLLGFQREDKKFHPHLTLGRVRAQRGMISLMEELDLFHDKQFGSIRVDQVKLMKSELKQKGAEYRCLHTIPLGVEDAQ